MNRQKKKQEGITLLALVVTIILMLILAGVSINFLAGENGLIARVTDSKEKAQIERYKEVIELDRAGSEIEAGIRGLDDKSYMDKYQETLEQEALEGNLKGSSITRKDNETVRVVTKEGYVYDVTPKGINYLGKQGEEDKNLPEINQENIHFSYNPSGWTNTEVEVTIELVNLNLEEGYYLQYSINGTTWEKYEKSFKVADNNTKIYARVVNGLDEHKGEATGNVLKIDRLDPKSASISAGTIKDKILTLTASGEDEVETKINGSSGIAKYEFYVEGILKETKTATEGKATYDLTTTFDNPQEVYVIAYDEAGNHKQSETITTPTDYTIKTLEELKTFRDKVNGGNNYNGITITQIADIDIGGETAGSWKPIGNISIKFNGTYNGGDKKISGLYITEKVNHTGLFGEIDKMGIVENLTVSNASVSGVALDYGILAGWNYGTIENVKIVGGTIECATTTGGICGVNHGKIISCSNSATVKNTSTGLSGYTLGLQQAGIAGVNYEDGTIESCINTGEINGLVRTAGITSVNRGEVELCINEGKISGKNSVAGICEVNYKNVTKCGNSGSITSNMPENGYTCTAGVVGETASGTTSECYNSGDVTVTTDKLNDRAMGISNIPAGYPDGAILNCYNIGTIKIISQNKDDKYPVAAGITGQISGVDSITQIKNCYNAGNCIIEAVNGANARKAGILGFLASNSEISNCYWLEGTANVGVKDIASGINYKDNTQKVTSTQLKGLAGSLGSAYTADTGINKLRLSNIKMANRK